MFGFNLADVLASFADTVCDLDLVEIFSGKESIATAAKQKGLASAGFDKARVLGVTDAAFGACSEDICSKAGFQHAVRLVGRLRKGGLLWMAPQCSSWVFYNVSRTKRSRANGFMGDQTYAAVQSGNTIAQACVFLLKLASARGVDFAVENPKGSYIWHSTFFLEWVNWVGIKRSFIHRCGYDYAPVGQRILKVYQVVGSGSWIQKLETTCQCEGADHQHLTISWQDGSGRKRTKGNKELLRQSQTYPPAMGRYVVQCWLQAQMPRVQSPEMLLSCARTSQHSCSTLSQNKTSSSSTCPTFATWLKPAAQGYCSQSGSLCAKPQRKLTTTDWLVPSASAEATDLHKKARLSSSMWMQPQITVSQSGHHHY